MDQMKTFPLFFFIVLSSSLKPSFSLLVLSPLFFFPYPWRFLSPFSSIPPSLLSTLKEKQSSLSIYLRRIKRK
nr:MAG TPA_asm: hypothetical protein [Caudoviricetes sp.]